MLTRNTTLTRVNHWITGILFVLLTLSGLAMFHPALFFLSDLFVAKDLVDDDVWNRVWGLPLYYAGQLLMAWSIAG